MKLALREFYYIVIFYQLHCVTRDFRPKRLIRNWVFSGDTFMNLNFVDSSFLQDLLRFDNIL